jgi:hypothetical protein
VSIKIFQKSSDSKSRTKSRHITSETSVSDLTRKRGYLSCVFSPFATVGCTRVKSTALVSVRILFELSARKA